MHGQKNIKTSCLFSTAQRRPIESPCSSVTVSMCTWVKRFKLPPLCSKEKNLDVAVILRVCFFFTL